MNKSQLKQIIREEVRSMMGNKPSLKRSNEQQINEDFGTIALGVAGGLLALKVLKFVAKKIIGGVARNAPLGKEPLYTFIDSMTKELIKQKTMDPNGKLKDVSLQNIVQLRGILKGLVDKGHLKTMNDIENIIKKASKSVNEDRGAYNEIENDTNKAKKLANLMAPGDDMMQQAAQYGPYEVLQVGADAIGSGSGDMYAYDGVFTQYDFMLMFRKAGYSNEAIEILMDSDYVQRLERG